MNKEDIIQIAKTITYDEFMDKYCDNLLCPSMYGLDIVETRRECYDIECYLCWEKALKDIKFKEKESYKNEQ